MSNRFGDRADSGAAFLDGRVRALVRAMVDEMMLMMAVVDGGLGVGLSGSKLGI